MDDNKVYIKLIEEIKEYCDLNGLDETKITNKALRDGFTAIKYGSAPKIVKIKEKPLEVIKKAEIKIKDVMVEPVKEKVLHNRRKTLKDIYDED